MEICETCGNHYEHSMRIHIAGKDHSFDCFECAIHALAPQCANCGVKVLGHGVDADGTIYCSAHCGRMKGERGLCDRIIGKADTPQWSL